MKDKTSKDFKVSIAWIQCSSFGILLDGPFCREGMDTMASFGMAQLAFYGMDDSFGILRGGLACREGMDILASFGVAQLAARAWILRYPLGQSACLYVIDGKLERLDPGLEKMESKVCMIVVSEVRDQDDL